MPLWQIDIYPAEDQVDREGQRTSEEIRELGFGHNVGVVFAKAFLFQAEMDAGQVEELAASLLGDEITERTIVAIAGDSRLHSAPVGHADARLVNVLPKAGVMDPVAASTMSAALDIGCEVSAVRTMRKYWISNVDDAAFDSICRRALSNDSIEQVVAGPLEIDALGVGMEYGFELVRVPIRQLSDPELETLSREGQLYLTLVEMQTIRDHFVALDRDPTDAELETIAQTWSEHCSHKTLAGRIHYRGVGSDGTPGGDERQFDNMLKEQSLRRLRAFSHRWARTIGA